MSIELESMRILLTAVAKGRAQIQGSSLLFIPNGDENRDIRIHASVLSLYAQADSTGIVYFLLGKTNFQKVYESLKGVSE